MLKERLRQLFVRYESVTQEVIAEVLQLEQEHISKDKPHLKEPIDQIIAHVAAKQLKDSEKGGK
ncbi:MAG TPA: hypothetical protein VFV38_36305 [Ktedonobacteraceae bacterium]|nr:hypothetical protein [Ktedonobacteraceae bacterium]